MDNYDKYQTLTAVKDAEMICSCTLRSLVMSLPANITSHPIKNNCFARACPIPDVDPVMRTRWKLIMVCLRYGLDVIVSY